MADIADHMTVLALVDWTGFWNSDTYWTLKKVSEFFNIYEINFAVNVFNFFHFEN